MSAGRGFTRGYTPTERQKAWWRSPRFREISRRTVQAWNAKRDELPKCGAKRRTDGGVCQNLPLENGRCRFHGGRVPKGKNWHLTQWPTNGPDAARKAARKLRDGQRKADGREERLAAMTRDERAAYAAWRRSHDPLITPGERARRAEVRRRNREAGALFSETHEKSAAPEVQEFERMIDELKRKAAALADDPTTWRHGVFG